MHFYHFIILLLSFILKLIHFLLCTFNPLYCESCKEMDGTKKNYSHELAASVARPKYNRKYLGYTPNLGPGARKTAQKPCSIQRGSYWTMEQFTP